MLTCGLNIQNQLFEVFGLYQADASENDGMIFSSTSTSGYIGAISDGDVSTTLSAQSLSTPTFFKNGVDASPTTRDNLHTVYHDGVLNIVGVSGEVNSHVSWIGFKFWSYGNITTFTSNCNYSEDIVFLSDQSVNRTAIVNDIAGRYGITV